MFTLLQIDGLFNGLMKKIDSPNINEGFDSTTLTMVAIAMALAGIMLFIQIAIELGKRFTGTGEGFAFLPKYAIMAICLACYIPLMKTVDAAMSVPTAAMKKFGAGKALEVQKAKDKKTEVNNSNDPIQIAKNISNNVADAYVTVNPTLWGPVILDSIISWACDLIDLIVFLIRQYLLNVLFVLGPLALAFSFIKNMEGSFMGFLKYYIVIHLWGTVAFVLEAMYSDITIANINQSTGWFSSTTPSYDSIVYKLGFIILHIMIPKIADILISGSQGGAFFSAATAAGMKGLQTLAEAGKAVATGGASTAATAATSVGKIVK